MFIFLDTLLKFATIIVSVKSGAVCPSPPLPKISIEAGEFKFGILE